MKRAAVLLLLLAACGPSQPGKTAAAADPTDAGGALERTAIARGVVADPQAVQFAGRYERRSDLGTDKFCAVARADGNYTIGALAVFGADSGCEGQGTARREGDGFAIRFEAAAGCTIRADYDGVELRLSGDVPESCAALCDSRASFAGTSYYLVEPGDAAAGQTLGKDVERLCA